MVCHFFKNGKAKRFLPDYFRQKTFEGESRSGVKPGPSPWLGQAPYKKHIDEAIYNLLPTESDKEKGKANPKIKFPPHLFWGVKMYPPLGYSPDLYNQCRERYDLPSNFYDFLKEFYQYCEKAQIPITAHASPLGMSIGDGFNYVLNDYQQRQKKRAKPHGRRQVVFLDQGWRRQESGQVQYG